MRAGGPKEEAERRSSEIGRAEEGNKKYKMLLSSTRNRVTDDHYAQSKYKLKTFCAQLLADVDGQGTQEKR